MSKETEASYNDFLWYKAGSWSTLEQGDLLLDCPVPAPPADLTEVLMKAKEGQEFSSAFDVQTADLIILTQSCDLQKADLTHVLLCAHFPAKGETYSNEQRNAIRKEHRPALHMIEACELDNHAFGQRVVDFRTVFTLPKDFVLAFVSSQKTRVRLLPPYREHLAQAFARYFMRVGLPRNLKDS